MAQEYFINSQQLQSKIDNLLPSQGGAGAGFDLSASTQIVPIIDLTESAEGSNFRQDLQSSLSFKSVTEFAIGSSQTVIVNTTGYFRVFGNATVDDSSSITFNLFDGTTSKDIFFINNASGAEVSTTHFDFIVFLQAGESFRGIRTGTLSVLKGCTRQLADIDGNLTNP